MPAKSILLSFILVCWMGNAFARQRNTVILPQGTLFLRFNPLGLIDIIDQNISAGAEYRFKPKWSAAVDAAYIFQSNNLDNLQSAKGYIIRPAVRKYFSRQLNHYVEAELHYKHLATTIEDWVGRNVVNGVPAYEEYRKFRYIKEVAGLQVKLGVQECLVQKKWLWIELYAGFGVRKKWQHAQLPPGSSYTFLRRMFSEDPNQSNTVFPAFPGGVRLLFKIK
jgi:hypothetical protein